jgi:membrane-bound lytic murein transglycosylase D
MNKLLLLATSLISLTIQSQGATHPERDEQVYVNQVPGNDSLNQPQSNPKQGFKNLFESENVDGISIEKLNPKAISFVQDYMEDNTERLNKMKSWGRPYFDMINNILEEHRLPKQLKYLSVIESDLKSGAVSWAGAVGPWQLMPETARLLGLKVSRSKDERRDYKKSTHAAAKYLNELYSIYNDWLLVIAAYNCGPGNVNSAIRRSGSRNFWDLQYHLPAESRKHVKKFIATHYIMEGEGGLTTLTKKETENLGATTAVYIENGTPGVTISGKYNSLAIAAIVQINTAEFNRLNPNFDRQLASNGAYELHLPADKLAIFQERKAEILEQSVRLMLTGATR